jgi:hypothetical protein
MTLRSSNAVSISTGPRPVVVRRHRRAADRDTGSAFGFQARFPRERVSIEGRSTEFVRRSDDDGEPRTFHFCPDCGATVYYVLGSAPDVVAIPVGAFADPGFPPPDFSVLESRKHAWVMVPPEAQHDDC